MGGEENIFQILNNQYSNLITAIATILYLLFTGWLIYETRLGRKNMEKPHLEIFLKRVENFPSLLELHIKNIGYSGAYHIKLQSSNNLNILDNTNNKLNNLGYFKNGISFLPVNGYRSSPIILMQNNYEEKIKLNFFISVEFKDKYNKKFKDKFDLNLSEFENTTFIGETDIYKIQKNITKIEKHLNKISKGFPDLQVITQTKENYLKEKEQEKIKLDEYFSELKNNKKEKN